LAAVLAALAVGIECRPSAPSPKHRSCQLHDCVQNTWCNTLPEWKMSAKVAKLDRCARARERDFSRR